MQNAAQSGLPVEAIDRAAGLIAQQDATPKSPGVKTADGGVALCAAAALAVAGLEIRGKVDEAETLRERIAESGSVDDVRKVFAEHDWSAETCEAVLIANDRLPPERRTAGVLAHFRALRSAVAGPAAA